jgi:ER membrane protein complex subunit 6
LSNIRSIAGLLLGIAAGILGLESLNGFAYYLVSQSLISILFYFTLADANAQRYFAGSSGSRGLYDGGKKGRNEGVGAWREVAFGGGLFTEALSGFVLGWAGVGGVIR